MQSKEDFVASLSYDKEIERAKWFKNDLEKGGWMQAHKSPGRVYWSKTFHDEEIPIAVLSLADIPLSAEMYMEILQPEHQEKRNKWDQVFKDLETVETYHDNKGSLSSCGTRFHFHSTIVRSSCTFHLQEKSTGSASERLSRFKRTPGTRRNPRELMVLSERQTEGISSWSFPTKQTQTRRARCSVFLRIPTTDGCQTRTSSGSSAGKLLLPLTCFWKT
ncbi:hypothetical protein OS493_036382 [Desmophyllum pertusum]|uniref:START domain-containing protein n=1 Tax=Desmophyllum pertusum TaxID=174260 RepID=A0A9W9YAH5_9CNID|nr:hypothetical protein OS493_036382 [Desmophyllum pertusum]